MSDYESFTSLNLNSLANNIQYERIRSLSQIDSNPSGSAQFSHQLPSNKMPLMQSSRFIVEFQSEAKSLDGIGGYNSNVPMPTGVIANLSRNAGLSMLSSIYSTLNNTTIGQSDSIDPAIAKQIEDLLFGSTSLGQTGVSNGCIALPLALNNKSDEATRYTNDTKQGMLKVNLLTKSATSNGSYSNIVNGSFNSSTHPCLSFKPPIPLWNTKQLLAPGSKIDITLNFNSNWHKLLFDVPNCDKIIFGNVVPPPDAIGAGNFTIGTIVKNIYLCLATITIPNASSMIRVPITVRTHNYDIYRKTMTSTNESIVITNQQVINRVTVFFVTSKAGSPALPADGTTSITNFNTSLPDASNPVNQLQSLTIRRNGNSYPSVPYTLYPYTDETSDKTDHIRAYQDFLFETGALTSNTGCVLSYENWEVEKIFTFRMLNSETVGSTNTEVLLTFRAEPTKAQCVIMTHYNLEFTNELDDNLISTVSDVRTTSY